MSRIAIAALGAAFVISGTGLVQAQEYPSKPIRIVTAAVGGGGDIIARLMAQALTAPLGQQVVVDNRGSGVIPPDVVAKSAPDGYTLLLYGNSLWVGPLFSKAPYDPVRDFAPISIISVQSNTLVVHPSLPVKSVKELIALAKSQPGQLNYAISAVGSANHMAGELFKSMAHVNIITIPYNSLTTAYTDLIAGRVHLFFSSTASATPHIKSGRLRPLAVTSLRPSALAPGIPTIAESGLPGYEAVAVFAMFGPAKTPPAVIGRLNQEIGKVLTHADVKKRFLNTGVEASGTTPEQLATAMKNEIGTASKIIKDAGIKVE